MIRAFAYLLLPALLVAQPVRALGGEFSGPLSDGTIWEGKVTLTATVEVPAATVLTIAPGTVVRPATPEAKLVVRGALLAEGTEQKPITFASAPGWEGIEFRESSQQSRLQHVRFKGAATAINANASTLSLRFCSFEACRTAVRLLRHTSALIEDCRFLDNAIAIDQEMRSVPIVRRNYFRGHSRTAILSAHNSAGRIEKNVFEKNAQAIALLRQYSGEISVNRFTENGTAIYCEQTHATPLIRRNHFQNNEQGILNAFFSSPRVEENTFIGNETAIRNDQLGSPAVRHNLFGKNGIAIANTRRSAPLVERNVLESNGLALLCDFSSYPQVRSNNFLGNRMGVELGRNQSADLEKRYSSRGAALEMAASRQGKMPRQAPSIPTDFNDFVDVRGNWWGEDTPKLVAAGPDGNVEIFFDRKDLRQVNIEGYGTELFLLDQVLFHPWLDGKVPDAGPRQDIH